MFQNIRCSFQEHRHSRFGFLMKAKSARLMRLFFRRHSLRRKGRHFSLNRLYSYQFSPLHRLGLSGFVLVARGLTESVGSPLWTEAPEKLPPIVLFSSLEGALSPGVALFVRHGTVAGSLDVLVPVALSEMAGFRKSESDFNNSTIVSGEDFPSAVLNCFELDSGVACLLLLQYWVYCNRTMLLRR